MKIEEEILKLKEQILKDKEFFWNHPEIEFQELETSKYIISRLNEMGYENIKTGIAKTGIMAELKGNMPGECILFRCDMDAVPIGDKNNVKHTCGHDAHMAILLGLAQFLINNKNNIRGHVKLVFQPAEEGTGGAKPMIEEGILENPKVDRVFAIHVWSEIEDGKIGIKSGPIMASTDAFDVIITGKGGHGALPEKCINPIYVANDLITRIQEVQNDISNNEKVVFGVTSVNAGSSNNVIPESLVLKGIRRTFNPEIRKFLKEELIRICDELSKKWNARLEIIKMSDLPPVINTKEDVDSIKEIAKNIVGDENIIEDYQTMCSEDFAFFLEERPGAFVFIGNKLEEYFPQHSEKYRVGENAIILGANIMCEIAKKYLF